LAEPLKLTVVISETHDNNLQKVTVVLESAQEGHLKSDIISIVIPVGFEDNHAQPIKAQSIWSEIYFKRKWKDFSTKIRNFQLWEMPTLLNFRFPEG